MGISFLDSASQQTGAIVLFAPVLNLVLKPESAGSADRDLRMLEIRQSGEGETIVCFLPQKPVLTDVVSLNGLCGLCRTQQQSFCAVVALLAQCPAASETSL